jgi:hypothetical protein
MAAVWALVGAAVITVLEIFEYRSGGSHRLTVGRVIQQIGILILVLTAL